MGSKGIIWVKNYHGRQRDLKKASKDAQGFYDVLIGERSFEYANDLACDQDLQSGGQADDIADIIFFTGHGRPDALIFGIDNKDNGEAHFSDIKLGSKTKWVVFNACNVLTSESYSNWKGIFEGLHMILGFNTYCRISGERGKKFAELLNQEKKLIEAWKIACEETEREEVEWSCLFAMSERGNTANDYWNENRNPIKDSIKQQERGYDIIYYSDSC